MSLGVGKGVLSPERSPLPSPIFSLLQTAQTAGGIEDVAVADSTITITLKYLKGKPVISGLKRVSTPGRRVYVNSRQIPKVQNGLGICILSTSSGVLDGMTAHEKKVGGELLCEIW